MPGLLAKDRNARGKQFVFPRFSPSRQRLATAGAGARGPTAPSAGAAWGLAGPPGRPGLVVKTSPSQASKQLQHSHRRSCQSPAKSCPRSLTSVTDADEPCTLISSQDTGQACGCCVPLRVVRRTREKLGPLAQPPLLVLSARSLLLQSAS